MPALYSLDPLFLSFLSLPVYFCVILVFFRFFGKAGLYAYMAIAIIGANTMVLKVSYFAVFQQPIALGTALFSSSYLASDLLSEYYGKKIAIKGVYISFLSLLVWAIISFFMLSYRPLSAEEAGSSFAWALDMHSAMEKVFSLTPAIFIASLLAYFLSQINDVYVFHWIKKRTGRKFLFIRNNVSTIISTLIDNTVFSFTAFVLLNPNPIGWKALLLGFILFNYGLRIIFALLDTPFIYLARLIVPNELKKTSLG